MGKGKTLFHKIARIVEGEYEEKVVDEGPQHPQMQDDKDREKKHIFSSITKGMSTDIDYVEGIAPRGMRLA